MNGFLGTYEISLDDKGRFNVPVKFRNVLERENNPNLVMTHMDGYLIVFPQTEWTRNEARLKDLDSFEREDRNKKRKIFSRAVEIDIKSGKILVPLKQRNVAGLNKEVVLVGMSESFEIWSKDLWLENEGEED
ncbi:MAG: division/cell wall cluster transcriptional repressor MraZ [Candidatus Nitrohelix vancouverensis]|uniref:Transcriptional regulator MraZ n=1 Tax=Candidatus Nitrohelix vancouverensis TaxID=2705534 RepID=A0A7T0C4Q3_9BACT|nr:MAG: division/cell wall cluster transcriptional repressor MraZ [Candidatus Nitrohelix vancouverensis]